MEGGLIVILQLLVHRNSTHLPQVCICCFLLSTLYLLHICTYICSWHGHNFSQKLQEVTNSAQVHGLWYQSHSKAPPHIIINTFLTTLFLIHPIGKHTIQIYLPFYYIWSVCSKPTFASTFRYPAYPPPQEIHPMVSLLEIFIKVYATSLLFSSIKCYSQFTEYWSIWSGTCLFSFCRGDDQNYYGVYRGQQLPIRFRPAIYQPFHGLSHYMGPPPQEYGKKTQHPDMSPQQMFTVVGLPEPISVSPSIPTTGTLSSWTYWLLCCDLSMCCWFVNEWIDDDAGVVTATEADAAAAKIGSSPEHKSTSA